MAELVTYLSKEKFVACGVFAQKNLEYIINDFVFIKKRSLEICSLEYVLNFCQKYSKLNLHTIVVISPEDLTVWVEDREKTFLRKVEMIDSQKTPDQNYHSDSQEKTIQKYRGREYVKENVIMNRNLIHPKTIVKKYRGRAY